MKHMFGGDYILKNIDRNMIIETLKKMGEKAREEAKLHGTYIVYTNKKGQTIREFANGKIEIEEK